MKRLFKFFAAAPIASFPVILAIIAVFFAVFGILSFIIPMSLGLWIATIVTFPAISSAIIAVTAAAVVISVVLIKKYNAVGKNK